MAKKRNQSLKERARMHSSGAPGNWGYYLFQDLGVSVVYVGKVSEDGSVEAALFGVDTWRDGLIVCHGRRFETKETFVAAMQDRSDLIKPSSEARCREEIAYGLRIRLTANADLPPEFDQWRHLVDPLEDVRLPSYLYRCPDCSRGLPEPIIQQILEGVDGEMIFYFLCDRCKRLPGRKSAEYTAAKHIQLIGAIKEANGFSVTWYQDNVPLLTRIQINPSYNEAVKMMISEGDAMRAACMAIESHIAYASVPNRIVEDQHILKALQAVDGELLIESKDAESDPVVFLVGAIEEGIRMFTKAMRFRGRSDPHVRSAIQEIMTSIKNHHRGSNPRAYIQFINQFIRV